MNKIINLFVVSALCIVLQTKAIGLDHPKPCGLEVDFNAVAKTKIKHGIYKHTHLTFDTGLAEASCVVLYNEKCKEGVAPYIGYQMTHLSWTGQHLFHQKEFNTAIFGVRIFTERCCNWIWRAGALINIDTEHSSKNIFEYMYYDMLLWGTYKWYKNINLHFGFVAQTGMQIDRVWPVIGFDWVYSPRWKINAIYPIDVSAVYSITKNWSAALAGRVFTQRHRLGKKAFLDRGLVCYDATGVELSLRYESEWVSADIHGGSTLGGVIKTASRHYNHRHRHDFEPSPYVGASIEAHF